MKLGIVGTREISEASRELVREFVRTLPEGTKIISGSARGVDTTAVEAARGRGLECIEFVPEYLIYGRVAPLIRNDKIVENSDKIVAFWDGQSKGTKYTIGRAKYRNIPVEIIELPVFQGDEPALQADDLGSSPSAGTIMGEQ